MTKATPHQQASDTTTDRRGPNQKSPELETGVAVILDDDCTNLQFQLEDAEPGQRNVFGFAKRGKDSWVETVKYSHRNERKIIVRYDRDGNVLSIVDGPPEPK